jgi:hypothetical protein
LTFVTENIKNNNYSPSVDIYICAHTQKEKEKGIAPCYYTPGVGRCS